MAVDLAVLESHLTANRAARLDAYRAFLSIPSISALPAHAARLPRGRGMAGRPAARVGLEHVSVEETGGHPVVYGDWLHATGAPTALVYGHYDVQPVDPLDLWESPPFTPIVEGDRI